MSEKMWHLQTETMKLQVVRVFSCSHCRRMMGRKNVVKRVGETFYRCSSCGGRVEDKTNSETGNSFLQVVGI